MSRRSLALSFLAAAGALLLLPQALGAGWHLDDHGFFRRLFDADAGEALRRAAVYVPGRNLYILYWWGLFRLLGPDPARFHALGVALELLNAALAFLLLRRLRMPEWLALAAAALFLVWPNHDETRFWTSALAMNLLSTTFILGAFLAGLSGRWPAAFLLYCLALFDYDQAFFMAAPLLWLGYRESRPGRWTWAFAGAAALQASLRLFVPVSEGGRPMARLLRVPLSAAEIGFESMLPLRRMPAPELWRSLAGGPLPTVLLVLALSGLWLWLLLSWRRDEKEEPAAWTWPAFGAMWMAAAYLPNLFWHVSPRHHYLPSLGWIVVLCSLLRAPRVFAAFFALCSLKLVGAANEWKEAAALHERLPAPSKPGAAFLFLIGAPEKIGEAPVFEQTEEHMYVLGRRSGRYAEGGDIALTPTRAGYLYDNRVDLYGRNFAYAPAADSEVLLWPGAALDPSTSPVRLVSSALRAGKPGAPGLESASASNGDGYFDLTLRWRAGPKGPDFAALAVIRDPEGRVVFDGEFQEPGSRDRRRRRLWPLLDDLNPPSRWPEGALVTQVFRCKGAVPPGSRLELTVHERTPAAWRPARTVSAAL